MCIQFQFSLRQLPFAVGGIPGSERASAYSATAIFYIIAPGVVHILLTTFVWGLSSPWQKLSNHEDGIPKVAASLPAAYEAKPDDEDNSFKIFGRTIDGSHVKKWFSPLRGLQALKLLPEERERFEAPLQDALPRPHRRHAVQFTGIHTPVDDPSQTDGRRSSRKSDTPTALDLLQHDPKFWQHPTTWWRFFKEEHGNGSNVRAVQAYMLCMAWKLMSLMKLTCGFWDEEQLEHFQIRYRSQVLGFL